MRLTRAQNVLHFARKLFKIASVSGAPPQTPLTTLPRTPSRKGLLAFGNRSFPPSALAISPTWTFWYLRIFLTPHGLKPNSPYELRADVPLKKLIPNSIFEKILIEHYNSQTVMWVIIDPESSLFPSADPITGIPIRMAVWNCVMLYWR